MSTQNYSIGKRIIALCVLVAINSMTLAQAVQNTTTNYQYDANGDLTQTTDPLGNVTNQTYDALNRLKQQTQPVPATGVARPVIQYAYDGRDQLTNVTDPRNLATSYTVDGLGKQTALASPDTGTVSRTYDAAGNLKTSTDARGKTTTYTYDALNRVIQISYATGPATTFTYDADGTSGTHPQGKLVMITDESGSTHYLYDGFGRVTAKIQTMIASSSTYTIAYQYGSSGSEIGHATSITYPSGNQINFSHDSTGRVSGITFNPVNSNGSGTNTTVSINLLTGIGYTPSGIPNAWTWGNDIPVAPNSYVRSTDLDGRLATYPLGNGANNGTVRTISYDAASRITATTHSGSGTGNNAPANFDQSFSYDGLDRATSLAGSSSQGYGYDASGNRNSLTIGANGYTDTIAAANNRLTATNGPAPGKTDTFDNAGNLTGDGGTAYTYSDRGKLASVTTSAGTTTYLYNGLNQRVSKANTIIPSGGNQYVYDEAGHLIGEYDATGKAIEETVYLGDMPVAVLTQTVTGTPPSTTTNVNVYYVYADHLNAPRVITQATDNQMVWRWDDADPFGMQGPDSNPSGLGTFTYNLRFPGQLYDQETNLFYNINRYYDPTVGRYTQVDPLGLFGGSLSPYSYVGGNPISYVDPTGLKCVRDGAWADCDTPGGPSFRIPVPNEWPALIDASEHSYHYYVKPTYVKKCKRPDLWPGLVNTPTPWLTNPATPNGTYNNVTPPWVQEMADGMPPTTAPQDLNPVISYVTVDKNTGQQIVVNVTQPGHSLWPGYTARTIVNTSTGSIIATYGEGLGKFQSDADRAQWVRDSFNDVWYDNQRQIAEKCGCELE